MMLKDKVSIISGIGPGLGQELAYVFAREGSDVVLAARTESKLEEVAAEIKRQWPERRVLVCPTDISDTERTQHLVDATLAEFGRYRGDHRDRFGWISDRHAAETEIDRRCSVGDPRRHRLIDLGG